MSNMTISIPHQLTRAEVKHRVQEQVGLLRQQGGLITNVQEIWTADRLDFVVSAMGQSVSGHLTIEDTVVQVEVVLPWFLKMLAGPLKQGIEQQGRLVLGDSQKK